jgi:hypothetical protein
MDIAVIVWHNIPSIFFFFHIFYSSYHRDTLCYFLFVLSPWHTLLFLFHPITVTHFFIFISSYHRDTQVLFFIHPITVTHFVIFVSSYHRDTQVLFLFHPITVTHKCYFCWTLNERGHLVCKYQVMLPHAVMASCLNNLHALSVILVALLKFCLYNLCLCLPFYVLLFAILCSFAYLCFYLVYLCSWHDVLLVVCLLYHISYMCFISLTYIYHFVV